MRNEKDRSPRCERPNCSSFLKEKKGARSGVLYFQRFLWKRITTICGFDEIKKEIEENECLHDWSLEYVAYDGTTGQITAKSYSRPTLFHFSFAGIQEISIDLDVLVRWIMEVEMVKGDNVTLTFDGVGIIITAKKVALKIQTQES